MNNAVIVLAAGQGTRLGLGKNKVLLPLSGQPILVYSLKTFQNIEAIDAIVIVAQAKEINSVKKMVAEYKLTKVVTVIAGGKTRQESVYQGLLALKTLSPTKVLIHDGARPFVTEEVIKRVIDNTQPETAVFCAVNMVDSLREVDEAKQVVATVPREKIYAVQTPQGFIYREILTKHQTAKDNNITVTDDAQLFKEQVIVEGDYKNLKVTTKQDWELVTAMSRRTRVGQGFDVHQFSSARHLVLGGVTIPYNYGLLGHSDADVVLHAIMDALLGSLALGDIGDHFPDTDNAYKDISSRELLRRVKNLLDLQGAQIENIDATILAEAPKIAPYKEQMIANIAFDLNLQREKISIKATTTEKLGFVGRKEGIAVLAMATVSI